MKTLFTMIISINFSLVWEKEEKSEKNSEKVHESNIENIKVSIFSFEIPFERNWETSRMSN